MKARCGFHQRHPLRPAARRERAMGHKPLDESNAPYYYSCPLRVSRHAPVQSPEWREGVSLITHVGACRSWPEHGVRHWDESWASLPASLLRLSEYHCNKKFPPTEGTLDPLSSRRLTEEQAQAALTYLASYLANLSVTFHTDPQSRSEALRFTPTAGQFGRLNAARAFTGLHSSLLTPGPCPQGLFFSHCIARIALCLSAIAPISKEIA